MSDTVYSMGASLLNLFLFFLFQEVLEKNLRLTQGMKKKRDDAESVDNDSTMSTSSNLEPFANDDLGIVKLENKGLKLVKTLLNLFELYYILVSLTHFFPAGLLWACCGKLPRSHLRISTIHECQIIKY